MLFYCLFLAIIANIKSLPVEHGIFIFSFFLAERSAVVLSVGLSAPNRRTRVRGSPGETPPCTPMAPVVCKVRRGCNVHLHYNSGVSKAREPSPLWWIPLWSTTESSPTLKPTYVPSLLSSRKIKKFHTDTYTSLGCCIFFYWSSHLER